MDQPEIANVVFALVRQVFSHEGELALETETGSVAGWDSFGTMEILTEIEERFGVDVPVVVIPELDTIGKIVDFIHENAN